MRVALPSRPRDGTWINSDPDQGRRARQAGSVFLARPAIMTHFRGPAVPGFMTPPSHVGIFWRVPQAGVPTLLIDSVPLAEAEPYDEFSPTAAMTSAGQASPPWARGSFKDRVCRTSSFGPNTTTGRGDASCSTGQPIASRSTPTGNCEPGRLSARSWSGSRSPPIAPTFGGTRIMSPIVDHRLAIREPDRRGKAWPRTAGGRRRYHKAFLRWHAANEDRFAIGLEWLGRDDASLEIGFRGISRVITAAVVRGDESVAVNWDGTFWDIIGCFEAIPRRVPGGYVCDLRGEDTREVHPSREDIWRIEIFEPFLEWVNGDLAIAEAVIVSGTSERTATWARLDPRPGQGPRLSTTAGGEDEGTADPRRLGQCSETQHPETGAENYP